MAARIISSTSFVCAMTRPELLDDELAEPEHRHELVVHLVGHAARERAHGLELLRLRELLLGLHAVRHVGVGADPLAHPSLLIEDRDRAHLHVAVLPVAPAERCSVASTALLADRRVPYPRGLGLILGRQRADPAAVRRPRRASAR